MKKELNPVELDFLLRFPFKAGVLSPVDFLQHQGWGGIKVGAQARTRSSPCARPLVTTLGTVGGRGAEGCLPARRKLYFPVQTRPLSHGRPLYHRPTSERKASSKHLQFRAHALGALGVSVQKTLRTGSPVMGAAPRSHSPLGGRPPGHVPPLFNPGLCIGSGG